MGALTRTKIQLWHSLAIHCSTSGKSSVRRQTQLILETSCEMMQNKLDLFSQKGPPQEPLRENAAKRLHREKEHSLGILWLFGLS